MDIKTENDNLIKMECQDDDDVETKTEHQDCEVKVKIECQDDEMIKQEEFTNNSNVLEALSLTSSPQEQSIEEQDASETKSPKEVSNNTDDTTVDKDLGKMNNSNNNDKECVQRKRKLSEVTIEEDEMSDGNEAEFCWDDYLDVSSSIAAPPTVFMHVEHSLDNIFKVGMRFEIPNSEPPDTYWIASVIMTCGPLLSMRYAGFDDDRSKDFWYDVSTNEIYPLGWCTTKDKELSPPACVKEKCSNWKEIMETEINQSPSVPENLLDFLQHGTTPVEQIKQSMKVEIQEELNPNNVWIATIVENVGGRLLLRYDGVTSHDYWLFYLSPRLHLVGWGHDNGCQYQPPKDLKNLHSDTKWTEILRQSVEESEKLKFPSQILEPQEKIPQHSFKVGMKLEALSPASKLQLCPATVSKVLNNYYFLVDIDDYRKDADKKSTVAILCCHANSLTIFPMYWGKEHGVKIHFPKGLVDNPGNKEFDWKQYLEFCEAKPAPRELFGGKYENLGLEAGMKLEVVNPYQTNQICAATVTRVIEPLIWIQFDSIDIFHSNHILPMNSPDIFPVGWCESNGFPLKPPRTCLSKRQRKIMKKVGVLPPDTPPKKPVTDFKTNNSHKDNNKAWCPIIYFNHKCFSGPFLGKSRLAELPKHVGPGPVNLVLKEVLTMLINVAYKSSRVLSELQLKGKPDAGMQEQVLKAKYKGRIYRAAVEIVTQSDQVEEFCQKICTKLECCPFLFGPVYVGDDCPKKCYTQTKTKYVVQFSKKQKKVGRPPLLPKNADGTRGPGRKPKKRRWRLLPEKESASLNKQCGVSSDVKETISQKENCKEEKTQSISLTTGEQVMKLKRKYQKFVAPKSPIVTRGVKLSNFGLTWRRRYESLGICIPTGNHPKPGRPPKLKPIEIRPKEITPFEIGPKETSISIRPKTINITINNPKRDTENTNIIQTEPSLQLLSNPLNWKVDDVVKFIKTTNCAPMARILQEQEVDGQAFLLLNLPIVQEFLQLKQEPAIRLCRQIERVKLAFYMTYA